MKKSVWLMIVPLLFCVLVGCGKKTDETVPSDVGKLKGIVVGCGKKTDETVPSDDPTQNNETAAVESNSETSPEGVMDRFLFTFFSGKDKEAWSLLTPKAQDATGDNFAAMASDTVTWEIAKKTVKDDMAYLFVNVSDLTDTGDRSKEELIFVLRRNDNRWGVAGFNAGELAVDYEQTVVETYSESESAESAAPENAPSPVTARLPAEGESY